MLLDVIDAHSDGQREPEPVVTFGPGHGNVQGDPEHPGGFGTVLVASGRDGGHWHLTLGLFRAGAAHNYHGAKLQRLFRLLAVFLLAILLITLLFT